MTDTIAAIATPPGNGGVAVIRISGAGAEAVLRRVFSYGRPYERARLVWGQVVDGGTVLDSGLAVMFFAPRSYTGEDVAELHCHGGAVGAGAVLRCVLRNGARAALPGEFTKRAFMNGRMDLTQAEAVCDYIGARSQAGARACARQMQGALKREVTTCQDRLTDVIARVEAAVEYPEEDLEPLVLETALPVVSGLAETVSALEKSYRAGRVLKEGLRVTIAGRPNVGKSSLLNVLTGVDRAIVSGSPGTTRDTIEQCYAEDGIEIIVTDTAGIRDTADAVEAQGVRRSKDAVDDADLVLFLRDSQTGMRREDAPVLERLKARADAVIPVWNKIDVSERLPDAGETGTWFAREPAYISAKTGQGIDALKKRIRAFAGAEEREGVVVTSERHREILCRAAACLRDAENALREGLDMDCVTIDLRAAWSALGEMTGSTAGEAIIDRIFEKFCLGK